MNRHKNALLKLAAAFPNPPIPPETMLVYLEALSTVPPDMLEAAVTTEIASAKHFPRVSELLERVRRLKVAREDTMRAESQRRMLTEPKNPAPPSLTKLLAEQKARGGGPKPLFGASPETGKSLDRAP